MKNYMHETTIKERGYVEVDLKTMTKCELEKSAFVRGYLASTLRASNCGWDWAEYRVMETPEGYRTEFLILWAGDIDNSGSRWINVSGNSLGMIICAMCDNLW